MLFSFKTLTIKKRSPEADVRSNLDNFWLFGCWNLPTFWLNFEWTHSTISSSESTSKNSIENSSVQNSSKTIEFVLQSLVHLFLQLSYYFLQLSPSYARMHAHAPTHARTYTARLVYLFQKRWRAWELKGHLPIRIHHTNTLLIIIE